MNQARQEREVVEVYAECVVSAGVDLDAWARERGAEVIDYEERTVRVPIVRKEE